MTTVTSADALRHKIVLMMSEGAYEVSELAEEWNVPTKEALKFLRGHVAAGRLFMVRFEDKVLFPAFQFDERFCLRVELGPLLMPLLSAKVNPWDIWKWMVTPCRTLGEMVPEEAIAHPQSWQRTVTAAQRLAQRHQPLQEARNN